MLVVAIDLLSVAQKRPDSPKAPSFPTSKLESLERLEVGAQLAKCRNDNQLSSARHDRFVLQLPGVLVRDVHGVESDFHRGIDVAARAVADHPALRFYDLIFAHQAAVVI